MREGVQRQAQRMAEGQQRQQFEAAVRHIAQTVDARERELMADPDYARLKSDVHARIKLAIDAGARPRSPEDALAMVNNAYAQAKTAAAAKPRPATPPRPGSTSPRHGSTAPTSLEEAITLGFGG